MHAFKHSFDFRFFCIGRPRKNFKVSTNHPWSWMTSALGLTPLMFQSQTLWTGERRTLWLRSEYSQNDRLLLQQLRLFLNSLLSYWMLPLSLFSQCTKTYMNCCILYRYILYTSQHSGYMHNMVPFFLFLLHHCAGEGSGQMWWLLGFQCHWLTGGTICKENWPPAKSECPTTHRLLVEVRNKRLQQWLTNCGFQVHPVQRSVFREFLLLSWLRVEVHVPVLHIHCGD